MKVPKLNCGHDSCQIQCQFEQSFSKIVVFCGSGSPLVERLDDEFIANLQSLKLLDVSASMYIYTYYKQMLLGIRFTFLHLLIVNLVCFSQEVDPTVETDDLAGPEGMDSLFSDLANAIPGIDEAMSFAEMLK